MGAIRHTVDIDMPVLRVYKAVTEEEGLRGWWTRQAKAAAQVGHVNEFPFASGDYNAMRVVALEADRLVKWECVDGSPEWVGTHVVFEMEGTTEGTRLVFTHTDWRGDTPFFRMCRKAWEWYMASLKQYCETGMGTPS
jgi:uncharacterized protein YndB with AHSA1/START domain